MVRRTLALLLAAALGLAQDGKDTEESDDEGISIDEVPSGPEEEEKKPEPQPARERTTAFPAREPGKKIETVVISRKPYSFTVPADWVLREEKIDKTELAWKLLLPGSSGRGALQLDRIERSDPRSFPYYQAEWFRKEKPGSQAEVRTKPYPRVVVRRTDGGPEWIDVYFCLSVRNNTFKLRLCCDPADFAQAEADVLATVQSFTAEVEIWPPIPKGYETSQEGTWLVARAPTVTSSIAPLVKALKEIEKRFRREHGPLPKSDGPLVVLVHPSKAQGAKLEPEVGERTIDFYGDQWTRRLFAIPFPKENVEQESMLAGEATDLLFLAKYGDSRPDWISWGEHVLASAETRTGKPLPSLDSGYLAWYSTIQFHRLDDFAVLQKNDSETWTHECLFYVAALREGKYKKQYRAFLADLAETADGLGAFERHLGSIDQGDLIKATNQYVTTRIEEVKRKDG